MKVLITALILLVSVPVFAPEYKALYVPDSESINPYIKLIYAVGMVECQMDTTVINPVEQAYGYFQIRQVRIEDYNKRTGSTLTLKDMLDYEKAEPVFLYYATRIGFRDPCLIARQWNGSGPKTWEYWKKVMKYL